MAETIPARCMISANRFCPVFFDIIIWRTIRLYFVFVFFVKQGFLYCREFGVKNKKNFFSARGIILISIHKMIFQYRNAIAGEVDLKLVGENQLENRQRLFFQFFLNYPVPKKYE